MLRYAITNRALFAGEEPEKRNSLLRQTFHWVRDGFDFIQLREKDLSDDAIAELASEILEAISATAAATRLLINSRVDVAVATRAHGVHLTAAPGEMTPDGVRRLYASARLPEPVVSVLVPHTARSGTGPGEPWGPDSFLPCLREIPWWGRDSAGTGAGQVEGGLRDSRTGHGLRAGRSNC